MRDPLRVDGPLEMLGLLPGATDAEIARAFKEKLPRSRNVQQLMAAKKILDNPVERALLRVLQYDGPSVAALSPSVIDRPEALALPERAETAAAWENSLRRYFPDVGTIHSLAVLWYWWALYWDSMRVGSETDLGLGQEIWKHAIAYWSCLAATDAFWVGATGLEAGAANEIATRVVEELHDKIRDAAQRHRDNADETVANRYDDLDLDLAAEVQTAKAMARAGIQGANGAVCAGRLLLERLGLLGRVQLEVDTALARRPSESDLMALHTLLSPFGPVMLLVDGQRAEEALVAIELLPPEVRDAEEVATLRTRALIVRAQQLASVGSVDEAIDCLATAIKQTRGKGRRAAGATDRPGVASVVKSSHEATRAEARAAILSICLERATILPASRDDEAIALLEKALKSVKSPNLRLALAERLTRRGIATVNRAQEPQANDGGESALEIAEAGLSDLERASYLGSDRAEEQVVVARDIVTQMRGGARANTQMARAVTAAQAEDWDTAIAVLRESMAEHGGAPPVELRQSLATCLMNRATKTSTEGMALIRLAQESRRPDPKEELTRAYHRLESRRKASQEREQKRLAHKMWLILGILYMVIAVVAYLSNPHYPWRNLGWPHNEVAQRAINAAGVAFAPMWFVFYVLPIVLGALSSMQDWFKKIMAMGKYPYYGNVERETCALCGSSASYRIDLGTSSVRNLCSSHVHELESEAASWSLQTVTSLIGAVNVVTLPPAKKQLLVGSKRDLEDAKALYPAQQGADELLDEIRAVLQIAENGLPMPDRLDWLRDVP